MTSAAPDGLLLLDKPVGITSHTAVRRAARALGIKRAGHAGTLDPLASGLLLVGVGKATRLLELLVGGDKRYLARVKLGEVRDTLDREGALLEERPVGDFTRGEVEEALAALAGEIDQVPPVYSAIKKDGVPLHRRARRGEEVTPAPRRVTIYEIRLEMLELPWVELFVHCSSGTYVRSIARDLGEKLDTGGALFELRRLSSGAFRVEEALSLEQIEAEGEDAKRHLLPPLRMAGELPSRLLTEEEARRVAHGGALADDGDSEGEELVLLDPGGELLALARRGEGIVKPRKVFL